LNIIVKIHDAGKRQILNGEFGIAGVFSAESGMDKHLEENMVRFNIPAILMPYIRSAITSILAQAGFGTIVLPLINVYEIAKNMSIQVIDNIKPIKL
jgi:preprotein translocase subunit SecB